MGYFLFEPEWCMVLDSHICKPKCLSAMTDACGWNIEMVLGYPSCRRTCKDKRLLLTIGEKVGWCIQTANPTFSSILCDKMFHLWNRWLSFVNLSRLKKASVFEVSSNLHPAQIMLSFRAQETPQGRSCSFFYLLKFSEACAKTQYFI